MAVSDCFYWFLLGDLNARPPAPKAVLGARRKVPVFNCFGFKEMRRTCCNLWRREETGGSRQLQFYLQRYNDPARTGEREIRN